MAYCDDTDLLIKADVLQTPGQTLQMWVDRAAEEMDSMLGFRYVIPITPAPNYPMLATHETLILKQINVKLASGRFYLANSAHDEDDQLHSYGRYLVNEALASLRAIVDGTIDLESAQLTTTMVEDSSKRMPGVINRDDHSLVEDWEDLVMWPNGLL
jgi:ribosomal protein S18 acetylase RimI-like enzyme